MKFSRQTTLRSQATVTGVGVHSGLPVNLTLGPAPLDAGFVFLRSGLEGRDREVQATAESVIATEFATVLGDGRTPLRQGIGVALLVLGQCDEQRLRSRPRSSEVTEVDRCSPKTECAPVDPVQPKMDVLDEGVLRRHEGLAVRRGTRLLLAQREPRRQRDARDHADEVAKRIPARRVGTPEDMAGAAIFLASRAGDYVIGSTLTVDGGVAFATPAMRDLQLEE